MEMKWDRGAHGKNDRHEKHAHFHNFIIKLYEFKLLVKLKFESLTINDSMFIEMYFKLKFNKWMNIISLHSVCLLTHFLLSSLIVFHNYSFNKLNSFLLQQSNTPMFNKLGILMSMELHWCISISSHYT